MVALFVSIYDNMFNILHGESVLPNLCLYLILLTLISIQMYVCGIE